MNIIKYFSLEVAKVDFGGTEVTVVRDEDTGVVYYSIADIFSVFLSGDPTKRNVTNVLKPYRNRVSVVKIHGVNAHPEFVNTSSMKILVNEMLHSTHNKSTKLVAGKMDLQKTAKSLFGFSAIAKKEFDSATVVENEYSFHKVKVDGFDINCVFVDGSIAIKVSDVRKYLGKSTRSGLTGLWSEYPFTLKVKGRSYLFVKVHDLIILAKNSSFADKLVSLHNHIIEDSGFKVRPFIIHESRQACMYNDAIVSSMVVDDQIHYHLSGLYRALGHKSYGDSVKEYAEFINDEFWITKEDMKDFVTTRSLPYVHKAKWKEFLMLAK